MFYKKISSVNNIFQWRGVSTLQFFNSSVLNFLPTQYQQVSTEGKYHRGISGVLWSVNTLLLMLLMHIVLSRQMTPTGNGKILHNIYLLGLKTQKITSACWTLKKRVDRPEVYEFSHADVLHST